MATPMGSSANNIYYTPKPQRTSMCHKSGSRHAFTYHAKGVRGQAKPMVDFPPGSSARHDLISFKHKSFVDRLRRSNLFWFNIHHNQGEI